MALCVRGAPGPHCLGNGMLWCAHVGCHSTATLRWGDAELQLNLVIGCASHLNQPNIYRNTLIYENLESTGETIFTIKEIVLLRTKITEIVVAGP